MRVDWGGRTNVEQSPSIQCRLGLAGEERAAAERLAARCNQREGLELPLNLSPPEALREGDADQLLYYEDGALVGVLSTDYWSEAEVCLAVKPEQRRRGVGRALLAAARDRCRLRGLSSCLLVTD